MRRCRNCGSEQYDEVARGEFRIRHQDVGTVIEPAQIHTVLWRACRICDASDGEGTDHAIDTVITVISAEDAA